MNRKLICSAVALACLGAAGSLYAQDKQQAITTVVKITGINWFNRMEVGVKEYGAKNAGVKTYQTGPGQADAAQQLRVIEDLVAKNVTALAVVPFDTAALEPVLKKAMDKGIVVVTHEAENQKNTQADIEALCKVQDEGVQGVICGRAIYTGDLDFAAGQERADELTGE